jgi:hypothetical protein
MLATMTATTSTASAATSLRRLLSDRASAAEITRFLDGLSPSQRVEEVLSVTGGGVKRLYNAMAGAPPASLDELIPPDETGTLIYEGRNSLPMFSRFQKRFARVQGGVVVGYNHQSMSFVTGPGYFLVEPGDGKGEHGDELLFDYTRSPPAEPAGWPRYSPNDSGLSRPVYGNLKDYVRRVARGVIVGKAYKLGVDQGAYFSLSRAV